MSLETRIATVVATVLDLPPESVGVDASRDTIDNWDSVNIINMMLVLETEFGVSFHPDEAEQILSVPLIAAILREKGVSG